MDDGARRFIGIDPGRSKCGMAVVDEAGTRHSLGVVPTETLVQSLAAQAQAGPIAAICVGDATTSAAVVGLCKNALPGIPIAIVDERRTTLEARQRYYQDHPPRGLLRLIPRGLLVPNEPLDGYAALLIVERFLSRKTD
ncbi:MAG: Holliday junction resolvase RuvX [Candidatus Eremiobacteraeota bacterium]|nr:Holliday junction resolvase RuvX [Candidatus Eremiobacteraeota bacterium]MBV8282011.1 Holliday junction resolvase RuvX [Candidatus Eremiobacteraeota bacterium]